MHINREQDHRGIFYFDVMCYVKVMRCHLMTGRQKKDATSLQKQSLQIFCIYELDWNRF